MGSDETVGLSPAEASARLARLGENKNTSEKPPYIWEVASAQLRDPMNIMLVAVTVVSLVIGQVPTAILVALLATVPAQVDDATSCLGTSPTPLQNDR